MIKSGIDQDALIDMFAEASAKQGETLRKAVSDATLKALQTRELTLENMSKVVASVTQATSAGAAKNPGSAVDVQAMLRKAIDGMDAALLKAVQAQRKALQQLVDQGAGMRDTQVKTAMDGLEKMEDMFFGAMTKSVKGMSTPVQGPWQQAMAAMKMDGSATGAQAGQALEELIEKAQSTMRQNRVAGLRMSQALMDSYAAMVSGVLIGMSEGLSGTTESKPKAKTNAK